MTEKCFANNYGKQLISDTREICLHKQYLNKQHWRLMLLFLFYNENNKQFTK